MGMFDMIEIYLKCPYCGNIVESGQTKDLNPCLRTYRAVPDFEVNAYLGKEKRSFGMAHPESYKIPESAKGKKWVRLCCDCQSVSCRFDADRRDIISQGSPSGFGRLFYGKLQIRNGMFLSVLEDIELDGHDEAHFSSYKKNKQELKKLKWLLPRNKNQEVLAVRNWHMSERADNSKAKLEEYEENKR